MFCIKSTSCVVQAGEGGLDPGQVRGAALPEEAARHWGAGRGGGEATPLGGEEVCETQQLSAAAQDPQEAPARPRERLACQPVCRSEAHSPLWGGPVHGC